MNYACVMGRRLEVQETLSITMAATAPSYLSRDLSLISNDLTFDFVDNYIKGKSRSSGANHTSKGEKYFSETYLSNMKGRPATLLYIDKGIGQVEYTPYQSQLKLGRYSSLSLIAE